MKHAISLKSAAIGSKTRRRLLLGYNLFSSDSALQEALLLADASWAEASLLEFGGMLGSECFIELGRQANAAPPVLRAWDQYGHRIDLIDFHPAYYRCLAAGL